MKAATDWPVLVPLRFDPLADDGSCFRHTPGIYLICIRRGIAPPPNCEEVIFSSFRRQRVLYAGIAGTEGTKRASLRQRAYRDHFIRGNAGQSTLRKSIGVLFGYKQVPRDKNPTSTKTKFSDVDEAKLSGWMNRSLLIYFGEQEQPWRFEDALITHFNPPLNLDSNTNPVNAGFRASLSALRRRK